MKTTQEPNHIAKLNAQAKNILTSQDLETLTKKQFCKTVDNYVKTLLKTQIVKNRAEIVSCIEQLEGVASVRAKQTVTVTLNNGKKHRLSGDFIMNNSKLDFIQSVSEQKQKADQLQVSLQQLSETLKTFEMTIEQSERPITNSTILLNEVQQTTSAIKSHLRAILTEIGIYHPKP